MGEENELSAIVMYELYVVSLEDAVKRAVPRPRLGQGPGIERATTDQQLSLNNSPFSLHSVLSILDQRIWPVVPSTRIAIRWHHRGKASSLKILALMSSVRLSIQRTQKRSLCLSNANT